MINAYFEIVSYEGDSFRDVMDRLSFLHIFSPIIEEFDEETAKKIIKYIGYGFSMDSPKITVTGDRRSELSAIFKELEINPQLYTEVILLEADAVRDSAIEWLKFSDNAQLEFVLTLKQQYMQQQSGSMSNLKDKDGNIDYDQKQKCIEHMRELKGWIKEAEQELIQNNSKLREAFKDLHSATGNRRKSSQKGMESFLKDHNGDN